MTHETLVMKFGGASAATPAHFHQIAAIIQKKRARYPRVVVVVSAMANHTDELLALAKSVHPHPPRRELDMLVSVGERISIALLAMALDQLGLPARSFTGSQSGVITTHDHLEARIVTIRPHRLLKALNEGYVAIVAGFQGVSLQGEITTLGRGGSDTSAVAMAVALGAEKTEFYKDVDGVYSEDPKINPGASLHRELSYGQMLDILDRQKGRILHPRCVRLAQLNNLPLHIYPFDGVRLSETPGTIIGERGLERPLPRFEEAEYA